MSKFFEAYAIDDNTTIIIGIAGENCVLFEGSKYALLYDSLSGAGSLKAFVRELTDLPVIPVLSHAHPDHEGGFFEYGACYMHPDDIPLLYSDFAASINSRIDFENTELPYAPPHKFKVRIEDMIPPCPVRTIPAYDGDVFDLGGRILEVVHIPGHTKGSIALLEKATRSLFTADAINPNTLMHLPNGTTIEEYKQSVENLKKRQHEFDLVYTGHSTDALPATIVDDAIFVCDKILKREDAHLADYGLGGESFRAMEMSPEFKPCYGGYSNICYLEDRIFGKSSLYRELVTVM